MNNPGNGRDTALREGYPVPLISHETSNSPHRTTDAIVIGGGVLGLLTALELRWRGLDVIVIEAKTAGSSQSGRNLGFVRQQGRVSGEAALLKRSSEKWAELGTALGDDLKWTKGGHISLSRTDAGGQEIGDWEAVARDHQIPFSVFTGREIQQRFPWLSSVFTTAGFTPEDAHVDPAYAIAAIRQFAENEKVTICEGTQVLSLDTAAGRVSGVQTNRGQIEAPHVICAAGAWTSRLLRPLGIRLPLHLGALTLGVSGQVPRFTESTVWEVGGVGMRQTSSGKIVFGLGAFVDIDARWEDVAATANLLPLLLKNRRSMRIKVGRSLAGDVAKVITRRPLGPYEWREYLPNGNDIAVGLKLLQEMIPDCAHTISLEHSWAGCIDSTSDFLPAVGDVGLPGLIVAAGTSGHGMGIAPAVGEAVAQLAVENQSSVDLTGMSPARLPGFRAYGG